MEKEIENIIRDNQFSELSAEDKLVIQEWVGSEEEFDVLKQIIVTAPTLNDEIAPSSKLRASLSDTFKMHHGITNNTPTDIGKSKKVWLLWAISAAAVFALFMLLFPFNSSNTTDDLTAENKLHRKQKDEPKTGNNQTKTTKKVNSKPLENNNQAPIEGVRESDNQIAVVESIDSFQIRNNFEPIINEDLTVRANTSIAFHSDRLETYDLPEKSQQVIRNNPDLLDVLYTAF